ncbi:hypothetical protein GQ54DRAFT_266557, partial [Martensiomyces pterosporus]
MEPSDLFCERPLEPSIIEQIHLGDWSGLNDKLTQALLLDSDHEASLCSQLLRLACTAKNQAFPDPDLFSQGVASWINHCVETLKNSDTTQAAFGNTEETRQRVSAAFTEAIWTLSIEWEPDTDETIDEENSSWWKEQQLKILEQSKQLVLVAKSLIQASVVSLGLAKERLDSDMLEQIGAIPSATAFNKKYIRLNTTLNFKQTKYNLVREQSEGFSKLVTLIQATMADVVPGQVDAEILRFIEDSREEPGSDSAGSAVVRAIRSLEDLQSRVRCLLVDIRRLIGVFNIDPNRVVDIIIDCFISNVRHYWAFYIALLDASPWCQSAGESQKVAQLVGWKLQFYISSPDSEYKFTEELTTVAALLISHGLVSLSDLYSHLAPSSGETIEAEFDKWCEKMREEQAMAAGNSLSMMGGLDGGLGDDAKEDGEETKKDKQAGDLAKGEWANQHALLCAKLLAVGDTRSAMVYLKRFPTLARVHQPIADLVARVIDVSTRELYKSTDCVRAPTRLRLRLRAGTTAPKRADDHPAFDAWGLPDRNPAGNGGPEAREPVTFVLTPLVKKPSEVFFYDKFWLAGSASNFPQIGAVGDVPRVLAPWLRIAFLRLHEFPALLTRLIRLCRYGLKTGPEDEDMWVGFLRAWIVPAYSFSPPSAGLSNELWLLVSMLPLAKRHELYSDWEAVMTTGKPMLPNIVADAPMGAASNKQLAKAPVDLMSMSLDDALEDEEKEGMGSATMGAQKPLLEIELLYQDLRRKVRSVMRRLSGDTVKLMGRQLCSLCHPAPVLSLKIILDQVCSYDNLVTCVVEAFRYLTPLDIDTLFYVILGILDDPARAKLKPDGVNPAHWLQSLSSFIASYSHRHEHPRLDVILDYLLKRTICMVRGGKDTMPVHELVVVSDCILTLANIEPLSNAIDDQVQALQGGPQLRLEAYSMSNAWGMGQDATVDEVIALGTNNRITRRMAIWLTNMLVDKNVALSFVVAMSAHAQKTLKLSDLPLSNMMVFYDREYERTGQLLNLLQSNLKPEKYARLVPCPQDLVARYGVGWGLAVLWGRPNISMQLAKGLKQWEEDGEQVAVEAVAKEERGRADDEAEAKKEQERDGAGETESSMDVDLAEPKDAARRAQTVEILSFEAPLLPRDFVAHVASMLPPTAAQNGLSPEFVAVFWALTLYDIEVPVARYDKEIQTQQNVIKRVDALIERTHSRSKTSALTQMRARAKLAVDNLEKEKEEQRQHVRRIRKWLIAQKDYWFAMAPEQRKGTTESLIQQCILPRAVMSAADANFCAKFLWMMHFPLATNKFSLLFVYDSVLTESLSTLLATFTENETKNYARFLNASLAYLAPMHIDERRYSERAVDRWRGLTGFQQNWRYERGYLPPASKTIGQQAPTKSSKEEGDAVRVKKDAVMLSYSDFRTVMRKWQINLYRAFSKTLAATQNDTVRNAILALKEMYTTFPVISKYGSLLQTRIDDIAEGKAPSGEAEGINNLKVLAKSYSSVLGAAKKKWIAEASYYPAPPKPAAAVQSPQQKASTSAASTASASTKQQAATGGGQKTESGRSERTRESSSRSMPAVNIAAAAAAAAAAASTSASGTSSANEGVAPSSRNSSGSQRQPKHDAAAGASSRDSKRHHDRERDHDRDAGWRSSSRQHTSESRHAEDQRRESRSARDSPMRRSREDEHLESHSHKRGREDSMSDSKVEPPRQRQVTPSNAPSNAESSQRGRSATEQRNQSTTQQGTQAAKLSSEEVDRKRRELRAQLLKQQEEKQKQKQKQGAGGVAHEEREKEHRGGSSRHSSRNSSRVRESASHGERSRNTGGAEAREEGGRRSGRGS